MKKVFISYSRSDQDVARRVYEQLSAVDSINPWFDVESLRPSLKWRPAIRKAIRESDYFVALISSDSVTGKGVRHSELSQALDVLEEFPVNESYLFPVRLDECNMPRDELDDLTWVDLFPEFEPGMKRLIREITNESVDKKKLISIPNDPKGSALKYRYRVALIDINKGVGNIDALAAELNAIQDYFLFVAPNHHVADDLVVKLEGVDNFATYDVPHEVYKKRSMLNVDLVVMATSYPLAFEESDSILYNYFSGPSDIDERFMFVSLDQLYEFTKEAGCTFEQGFINIVVGQLLVYFSDIGYHDEIRGCPMDFCEIRHDIVKAFKRRKFCNSCLKGIKDAELKTALNKLLEWVP